MIILVQCCYFHSLLYNRKSWLHQLWLMVNVLNCFMWVTKPRFLLRSNWWNLAEIAPLSQRLNFGMNAWMPLSAFTQLFLIIVMMYTCIRRH